MAIAVSLEGKSLYLLDTIAIDAYGGDRFAAFQQALEVIEHIMKTAESAGLWYRRYSAADATAFLYTKSEYGVEDDMGALQSEEPEEIPIFPLEEGEAVRWNPIVMQTVENLLPPPERYRHIEPFQLKIAGQKSRDIAHLAKKRFGADTGYPLLDLVLTSLDVGTGIEKMEGRGSFYYENPEIPIEQPVIFFPQE